MSDKSPGSGWKKETCGSCAFKVYAGFSKPTKAKPHSGEPVNLCRRDPPAAHPDDGGYRYPEVTQDTPACSRFLHYKDL